MRSLWQPPSRTSRGCCWCVVTKKSSLSLQGFGMSSQHAATPMSTVCTWGSQTLPWSSRTFCCIGSTPSFWTGWPHPPTPPSFQQVTWLHRRGMHSYGDPGCLLQLGGGNKTTRPTPAWRFSWRTTCSPPPSQHRPCCPQALSRGLVASEPLLPAAGGIPTSRAHPGLAAIRKADHTDWCIRDRECGFTRGELRGGTMATGAASMTQEAGCSYRGSSNYYCFQCLPSRVFFL